MKDPKKIFPFPIWIHILSFLDTKSLNNTLLVNKNWLKYSENSLFQHKLDHITNRKKLKKYYAFIHQNALQRLFYFYKSPKNLLTFFRKMKEINEYTNPLIFFLYLPLFLPFILFLFIDTLRAFIILSIIVLKMIFFSFYIIPSFLL